MTGGRHEGPGVGPDRQRFTEPALDDAMHAAHLVQEKLTGYAGVLEQAKSGG